MKKKLCLLIGILCLLVADVTDVKARGYSQSYWNEESALTICSGQTKQVKPFTLQYMVGPDGCGDLTYHAIITSGSDISEFVESPPDYFLPFPSIVDVNMRVSIPPGTTVGTVYIVNVYFDATGCDMDANMYVKVIDDVTAPTGTPTTPTGAVSLTNRITFNWTQGTASDSESNIWGYYLQVGTTQGGNNKFDGDVGNVLTYDITNCIPGKTYYARVKAKNGAGKYSNYSEDSNGVAIPDVVTIIKPKDKHKIDVSFGNIDVKIEISIETFKEDVEIKVLIPTTLPKVSQAELKGSNIGVEITLNKNVQPDKEITITINYNKSDLKVLGLDETKLVVGYYDETKSKWIKLPTEVYPEQSKIIGKTKHLSKFQILQLTSVSNLSNVIAYPNPYKPNSGLGHTKITFKNLTSSAAIKIFTITGELVHKYDETDGNGIYEWNVKNDNGEDVASGVFIYLITNSNGEKTTGKIVIIK